jgi:hypothetical protein
MIGKYSLRFSTSSAQSFALLSGDREGNARVEYLPSNWMDKEG